MAAVVDLPFVVEVAEDAEVLVEAPCQAPVCYSSVSPGRDRSRTGFISSGSPTGTPAKRSSGR